MKFASTPTWVRATLLGLAALAATASSEQSSQPQPAYPYGAYPNQQGPYSAPAYGGDGYGGPAGPEQPQVGGAPGQDYCFTLTTPQTTTSMCAIGFGGCERQRQAAAADGQQTSECVPWSPVACFQLGGDPAPGSRFCAANLEDCELWRKVDEQKNGAAGATCSWKQ